MKRILILITILLLSQISYSQDVSICDVELVEGAAELCEPYHICYLEYVYSSTSDCTPEFYGNMLALCDDGLDCEKDALMNLIAVQLVVDARRDVARDIEQPLIDAIEKYKNQNFQQAGEMLLGLFYDYQHRYLAYGAGLAFEQAGSRIDALASYQLALLTQFNTPLVYYSRGQYYLSLGENELSSRDFYTFLDLQTNDFDLTQWLSVPDDMQFSFSDNSEMWTVYELMEYVQGEGGRNFIDNFGVDGFDIQLEWLDDGNALAISSAFTDYVFRWYEIQLPDILFVDCGDNSCRLSLSQQHTLPESLQGPLIEFVFNDNYAEIRNQMYGEQWGNVAYTLMMAASMSDPRPEPSCENGVYSRLDVGSKAYFTAIYYYPIYSEPSTESQIVADALNSDFYDVEVAGPMVCEDDGNWWYVTTDNGFEGWMPEAWDNSYLLVPEYLIDGYDPPTFDEVFNFDME